MAYLKARSADGNELAGDFLDDLLTDEQVTIRVGESEYEMRNCLAEARNIAAEIEAGCEEA